MSERDGYQPGVPCWVDTLQADPEAALRFYGSLFGWEFEGSGRLPGDSGSEYWVARLRGRDVAGIGSQPTEGESGSSAWNTYVHTDSVERTAGLARDSGGTVLVEPLDVAPAGRLAVVADASGAALGVWEPQDRQGAQLVNEPGAWSMSALNTSDPERAKDFYAAVFGWKPEVMDAGEVELTMFGLPGYVGGEPEQPVPRDVIATMAPQSGHEDAAPSWSVDFWVADCEATTARTTELGGKLVTEPYEIPNTPLVQAVVADPVGAGFSITEVRVAASGG